MIWFIMMMIISSVRSSSGDHGLIEIQQQQQQGHFSKFSNLEQSCLYTFIIHFHFHSVFNVPNRTRQYFCMNYIDNAFKFLQDSTRFFRFLWKIEQSECSPEVPLIHHVIEEWTNSQELLPKYGSVGGLHVVLLPSLHTSSTLPHFRNWNTFVTWHLGQPPHVPQLEASMSLQML